MGDHTSIIPSLTVNPKKDRMADNRQLDKGQAEQDRFSVVPWQAQRA